MVLAMHREISNIWESVPIADTLLSIAKGNKTLAEIAKDTGKSKQTLCGHLKRLREEGLIQEKNREIPYIFYGGRKIKKDKPTYITEGYELRISNYYKLSLPPRPRRPIDYRDRLQQSRFYPSQEKVMHEFKQF